MSHPFFKEEFTFTQPDGSQVQVRGSGDQHHAVFETLDGFTVVKDPITGYYQYAALSNDEDELIPTGAVAGPAGVNPENLGLEAGLRLSPPAARARGAAGAGLPRSKNRWEVRRDRNQMAVRLALAGAPGVAPAPPQRQTVGDFVGLCLLVDFPDVPATIPREEVEAFCNRQGYSGFGNRGSVYDYFHDNSGGKLRYTNVVAPYYTTIHPRSYYTNPAIKQPGRTYELIKEALNHLESQGFDFSMLSADDEGYIFALNVFYAGPRVNAWAEGLWPHSYHLLTPRELAPGKFAYDYQITDMGNELTLGTFCHENGHMICDFPDLYDYGYESAGVGAFCLMCAGGSANKKNPTNVSAYLKYKAGWSDSVTRITDGMTASASASDNRFFIYRKNAAEYFIVENRHQTGRDAALPDSGLAIWHIDELGSNNNEQMTAASHYECSLIQADGRFDLENGNGFGDHRDLFSENDNDRFGDDTKPDSKWWDGTSSSLEIYDVGPSGPTIPFAARL